MLANRTHEPAVVLRIGERQVNFWFAARLNHCGKANRAGHDYRSPLSPWPGFTLVFALLRRSAASDRPTSSDSLNCPLVLRRTNRLSVPVLMSSLFAINNLPPAANSIGRLLLSKPFAEPMTNNCSSDLI